MENILLNYPSDICLNQFSAVNYLSDFSETILINLLDKLTIEEKLILVVLDRDGYFYSVNKPSPKFLMLLAEEKIFIQAFSIFNAFKNEYGVFLKNFILENPKFKPTNSL